MITILLIIAFSHHAFSESSCGTHNYVNDPTPWGGANCTNNMQCGGVGVGVCDFTMGHGNCICAPNRAMPNCSYVRTSVYTPGVLNIVLAIFGFGGIGNLIIGRIGSGVGQLILTLIYMTIAISMCVICCITCFACCLGCIFDDGINYFKKNRRCKNIFSTIMTLACLAGVIWSIVDGAFILQCRYLDLLRYAMYYPT